MLLNGFADLDFPKNGAISVDELQESATIRLLGGSVLPSHCFRTIVG
jgi:hypothetical protein